jgi:hypothetical protein
MSVPGKARDAGKGRFLAKFRNAAWRVHSFSPEGRTPPGFINLHAVSIWRKQLQSSTYFGGVRRGRNLLWARPAEGEYNGELLGVRQGLNFTRRSFVNR